MKPLVQRVLVVGVSPLAVDVLAALARVGLPTVSVDRSDRALERLRRRDFAAVVVSVDHMADWIDCGRLASLSECPIAVVTHFLASDRRYRNFAFMAGVAAYIHPPCTPAQWLAVLRRIGSGERSIELLGGSTT